MTKLASESPQNAPEPVESVGRVENRSQGQENAGITITARNAMPDTNEQSDPVIEARELLAKATPAPWQTRFVYRLFESARRDPINIFGTPQEQDWKDSELIARAPELLKTLCDEFDHRTKALRMMVELWDAEHPDDPCGCVGASDDCRYPPTCELCVARLTLTGRINED